MKPLWTLTPGKLVVLFLDPYIKKIIYSTTHPLIYNMSIINLLSGYFKGF